MIRRIRSWFRKPSPPRAPAPGFDGLIAEEEARYEQLRRGLLQLLFVQTKLRAEMGAADPALQRRIRTLGDEMTRCRAELDELRRCRLDTAAEMAFLQAV